MSPKATEDFRTFRAEHIDASRSRTWGRVEFGGRNLSLILMRCTYKVLIEVAEWPVQSERELEDNYSAGET